jgi:hypothetical protein
MNNLWESSSLQANCNICDADKPFFISVERSDLVGLRFQVPWSLIVAAGLGIPTTASLAIVDEIGTTIYTDFGVNTSNRFLLGYRLDTTNKLAEYQIYTGVPMADELGNNWSQFYFTATSGQIVSSTLYGVTWVYGVDDLPYPFIEVKPGVIVKGGILTDVNLTDVITINGTPTTQQKLFSGTPPTSATEGGNCFRYRLTFTIASVSRQFFTKPFKVVRCDDTVRLEGRYNLDQIDCNQYMHSSSSGLTASIVPFMLLQRIPADIQRVANRIKKMQNENCFVYKSEIQKQYNLKSDPLPEWYVDEIENLMLAQDFRVNNQNYLIESAENIFENNEFGGNYQNINVSLQSCKCETVFVC